MLALNFRRVSPLIGAEIIDDEEIKTHGKELGNVPIKLAIPSRNLLSHTVLACKA